MDGDTTRDDEQPTGPKSGRVRIIGAEPAGSQLAPTEATDAPDEAEAAAEPLPPTSSGPELPHWTAAPTGEVPAVLARDRGEEDPWAAVPGPTWREEHNDWAASEDAFEPSMLVGEGDVPRGSLSEVPDAERQPWSFDLADPADTPGDLDPFDPVGGLNEHRDDATLVVPLDEPEVATEDPAPMVVGDVDEGIVAVYADEAGLPDADPPEAGRPEAGRPEAEAPAETPPKAPAVRPGSPRATRRRGRARSERDPGVVSGPLTSSSAVAAGAGAATAGPPAGRARPASTPPAERGGDRNMGLAALTGVILIALVLIALGLGTVFAMLLVTVLITIAAAEGYAAVRRGGYHPATLLGLAATVSLMVATYNKGFSALPLVVVLLTAFSVLWYVVGVEHADAVRGTASTLLVFCWVAVFGSYAALLLSPRQFVKPHGLHFLLAAIIVSAAYDIGALFVGRWIGSHSMAPSLSPGKTWEGAVGGALAAVVVAVIVVHFISPFTVSKAFLLGVVVAVVAPLGDLFESAFKRNLGLKDMSRILPGHGGLLDRVDGLLFILPATYYLVKAVHLG